MRNYTIIKILVRYTEVGSSVYYKKDNTTGFYVVVDNQNRVVPNTSPVGLFDILFGSATRLVTIVEIERNAVNNTAAQIFKVGDRLQLGQRTSAITDIKVVMNTIRLLTPGSMVDLANAILVPPAPVVTPEETAARKQRELTELQNAIIASYPREIRLEATKRARRDTHIQFLTKFFKVWNNTDSDDVEEHKNTIYTDNREVQTESGRRRSLGDLFMIMRYYYPQITIKELLTLLYVTLPASITTGFRTSKCNTIHKRVWYYEEGNATGQFDTTSNDEYNHAIDYYKQLITN